MKGALIGGRCFGNEGLSLLPRVSGDEKALPISVSSDEGLLDSVSVIPQGVPSSNYVEVTLGLL